MKILHLYYDLMNLYGEYANVSALERYLRQQDIEVITDKRSLGDEIDFSQYSFIYIGSGTEAKQLIALSDIKRHKDALKEAFEKGAVILATGNAFELFGQKIISPDKTETQALDFFDFCTEVTDKQRVLLDQVCICPGGKKTVGFINKASQIRGVKNPMFVVTRGEGNSDGDKNEGIIEKTFFGTHLTGPCLVKNPHIAEFFVRMLCEKEGKEFKGLSCEYEMKSYEINLRELDK